MARDKKEVAKGWLHHATQESACLIINSKEYKDKLKDGGYRKLMTDVLKDRELLEEAKVDETEGLTSIPSDGLVFIKDLSDSELNEIYDECDAELVKRGLLEFPDKTGEKQDDK